VDDRKRVEAALQKPVSRRSFLAAAGLIGGGAVLAACTPSGASSPASSSAPSPAAASEAPSAVASTAPSAVAGGPIEKDLFMYNWSDYIAPDNIDAFKKAFGVDNFQYDTFANNEELIAKLQGGASGYDIAAPTAEYVPGMVSEGFIQKLDLSRIPNQKYIDKAFLNLAWDPTNEYQLPKDYGTTGILYREKLTKQPVTSWKQFYDLTKGEFSGRTVIVDSMGDVFVFPLKLLGYSLNSVDSKELEEARKVLLDIAPHVLALDSDTYQVKLASEEAALCLGWTGPLVELRKDPKTADTKYAVPDEGTLFWMDTWVMIAEAPHPNASYAWLNFIHEPTSQLTETLFNGYATPNVEGKKLVPQVMLDDPALFPPDAVMSKLEGAVDTSGNNQRLDIWAEFKSKIGKS
jgi:spermidine/putrescine transport system substrate-binding protein